MPIRRVGKNSRHGYWIHVHNVGCAHFTTNQPTHGEHMEKQEWKKAREAGEDAGRHSDYQLRVGEIARGILRRM